MVKRCLIAAISGIVLFLSLSPFSFAAADNFPSYGPQTYQVHKYYYFGDSTYQEKSRQGISISVDASSVSYQSVKATIGLDYNLIMDRGITKFIVLANGVNVDEFEPYYDYTLTPPVYKEYYYLDINVSDQYIGSDVYFQVVALHQDNINSSNGNVYVVGWSQETPSVRLKPLPVTDKDTQSRIDETNSLLQQILNKLNELKNALIAKLDQVQDAIERIYRIEPATQARFNAAQQALQDKLPTNQIQDQANQLKDIMDESVNRINNTKQELKFGQINWMGVTTTSLLDFTDFADYIDKIRSIMRVMLWCEFFYFIILILRPILTV